MEKSNPWPDAAELIEHLTAGLTIDQMAAIYKRSNRTIRRWFTLNDLDWRANDKEADDSWAGLLAGGRFEDDLRANRRRA